MKDLQPHQQRVVVEKQELDDKINKLLSFSSTQIFSEMVDSKEQNRLKKQLVIMEFYSQILGERIDHF